MTIPKSLIRILTLALACAISTPSLSNPPRIINKESVKTFFDIAFETQKLEHELVGATIVVVKDSEILFKKGYGFADLEQRIPVDPDKHLFRIASISKTFTWTAVMQLVEDGKLDLEDDIQKYLDFQIPKTFEEPIRLKHLLTHTPGFEDQSVEFSPRKLENLMELGEYLSTHIPARVRKPGIFSSYSNYGSAVAGYIVERVSGIPWADYIQKLILNPLNMTKTNVYQPMREAHQSAHAKGYQYTEGIYKPTDYLFMHQSPAGLISSTADDMAKWMLAHLNLGKLNGVSILETETSSLMQSELFRQHPKDQAVLYGFYRADQNGVEVFGHGGDVNQFHSNLSLIPEHNLGIFVSYNSDPGHAARTNVIQSFLDYFFPMQFPEIIQPNLDVLLDDYTGTWINTRRNQSTFEKLSMLLSEIYISSDNNELIITAGSSVSRWIPVKHDYFRAKYSNKYLIFYRDDNNTTTHFSIDDGWPASFERIAWYESSRLHKILFFTVGIVTLLYLLRFIYLLMFNRDSFNGISKFDRSIAAMTSAAIVFLIYKLVIELTGDSSKFIYGIPDSIHHVFILVLIVLPLSLGVCVLSICQWVKNSGSFLARLNYGILAFVTLIFVILTWFWNILGIHI